jgi:hypothetical protein
MLAIPGTRFFITTSSTQIKIWDSDILECVDVIQIPIDPQFGANMISLLSPPSTLAVIPGGTYLRVYGGAPELKERAALHVPSWVCGILEVAPVKILMPAFGNRLKVWNFWDNSEKEINFEFDRICCLKKLSNGNILIGHEDQLSLLHVDKLRWKKLGLWFSLGRKDSDSAFGNLPVEVFFHFCPMISERLSFCDFLP